ncbi:MAG: peptide-methionine (S)-S-oxide reductase MsrA [Acetobacteraceae bacterium]|nr:peptide-methionine (S)-S-oxide reductase MsrA [Acetobacteraceae bacterium]
MAAQQDTEPRTAVAGGGQEEVATLGGGCFWCLDAVYRDLQGVTRVVSGYAGGHVPNPTYEQVCGKGTGHAEVVQVTFDPKVVSYADLLRVFFTIHDPTTKDRQGADVGPQYRSIILYHSEDQRRTAEAVMREIEQAGVWGAPLVTELVPAKEFWPAEPEHQNYFELNPWSGYCRAVIAPKVAKFRKTFADRLKRRPAA